MKMKSFVVNLPLLTLCLVITLAANSQATDFKVLKPGQQLNVFDSLVSPNKVYTLSFFNPDPFQYNNHYLGIDYMKSISPKYVWIANRDYPLSASSGILNLTEDGNLILTSTSKWNMTINTVKPESGSSNISASLSDSGNLVLKAGKHVVWQSFESPQNTFLPGIKVGIFGLKTKKPENRVLSSWFSSGDASGGAFTLGVDPENTKQLVIWYRDEVYWSSGIWVRNSFPNNPYPDLDFKYTSNENDSYFTFSGISSHELVSSCLQLTSSGDLGMSMTFTERGDLDVGMTYGEILICKENDYTGCVVSNHSHCKSGDTFSARQIEYSFTDWRSVNNYSYGLSDCQEMCKRNCSCLAYRPLQVDGRGCEFFENKTSLLHKRLHHAQDGLQVYIRSSILKVKGGISKKTKLGLGIGGSVAFFIVCTCCYFVWRKYFATNYKDDALKVSMNELGIAAVDEHHDAHKSNDIT